MSDTPLAYFLTFGTYGSWLHGDKRGSKDPDHNTLGESPRLRDDALRHFEERQMLQQPFAISAEARFILEQSFRDTCAIRSWLLLELNVRTEHVHIILTANVPPERAMTSLKAHGTRAMLAKGIVSPKVTPWARHGSTRSLWRERDVELARDYVLNHQGRDLKGSDWRRWRDITGETS